MAQKNLEIGSIGGKDSMSGSFENLDVPPTLVSFAVTTEKTSSIISPEFKKAEHNVVLLKPEYDENNLPDTESLKSIFDIVNNLINEGKVVAAYTPTYGGIAEAIMKMSFGNTIGFAYNDTLSIDDILGYSYGSFLLDVTDNINVGIVIVKQ